MTLGASDKNVVMGAKPKELGGLSAAEVREEYAKESKDQAMAGANQGGLDHQGPDLNLHLSESREQQREDLREWLRAKGLLNEAAAKADLEANIVDNLDAELPKAPEKVVWEIGDEWEGKVEPFKKAPVKASSGKPTVLSFKLAKTIAVWLAATRWEYLPFSK